MKTIACLFLAISTAVAGFAADLSLKIAAKDRPETRPIILIITDAPDLRAAQFVVTYNPEKLHYKSFKLGKMAKNALFAINDKKAGELRIALASRDPLIGDGNLAYLTFEGEGKILLDQILINGNPHKPLDLLITKGTK